MRLLKPVEMGNVKKSTTSVNHLKEIIRVLRSINENRIRLLFLKCIDENLGILENYTIGDSIYKGGDESDGIYILLSGVISFYPMQFNNIDYYFMKATEMEIERKIKESKESKFSLSKLIQKHKQKKEDKQIIEIQEIEKEMLYILFHSGSIFGALPSKFVKVLNHETALAVSHCRIYHIRRETIEKLISNGDELVHDLYKWEESFLMRKEQYFSSRMHIARYECD